MDPIHYNYTCLMEKVDNAATEDTRIKTLWDKTKSNFINAIISDCDKRFATTETEVEK